MNPLQLISIVRLIDSLLNSRPIAADGHFIISPSDSPEPRDNSIFFFDKDPLHRNLTSYAAVISFASFDSFEVKFFDTRLICSPSRNDLFNLLLDTTLNHGHIATVRFTPESGYSENISDHYSYYEVLSVLYKII